MPPFNNHSADVGSTVAKSAPMGDETRPGAVEEGDEGELGPPPSKRQKTSPRPPSKDELHKQRMALPMAGAKTRLLQELRRHHASVLVGETGSGKTTQVPQYILESGLAGEKAIAVTQPRRVAATSLCTRVANEMGVEVGAEVGYRIRFEDSTSEQTRIVYMTDGMLLREAMIDPLLSQYSWIVLDEAHERTVNTDILLGIVKVAQNKRQLRMKPLKVVVMSATLEAEAFARYFRGAPILFVSGRQFPVNVCHVSQSQDDWQQATLATVLRLHREAPERHDILVFLTGQEEIEAGVYQVRQAAKDLVGVPRAQVLGLFAAQQLSVQQKVFVPTRPGWRKIVIATNIAETSLTIPGIRYVVDSCRVKAKVHQASTGVDMLKVVKVSKAQALQRAGRAGREAEGHCYRILTRSEFNGLPEDGVPEIKRCNLAGVLLQMLAVGLKDVRRFDFMDRPPEDAIDGAMRMLRLLGAIAAPSSASPDKAEHLSDLGKRMAAFPLDPRFTKVLFCARDLGCTEEILTIISILSGEPLLLNPTQKREEAHQARKKFATPEGDHVMYLKLFRAYKKASNPVEWCQQHFVSHRHVRFAIEVRKQLMELCRRHGIEVQSAGGQTEPVRRALAMGLFTNVARLCREGHYVTLDSRQKVRLHPSSVLFQTKPEMVVFTELTATQHSYIRDLTLVEPAWLVQAQPDYFRQHRIVSNIQGES